MKLQRCVDAEKSRKPVLKPSFQTCIILGFETWLQSNVWRSRDKQTQIRRLRRWLFKRAAVISWFNREFWFNDLIREQNKLLKLIYIVLFAFWQWPKLAFWQLVAFTHSSFDTWGMKPSTKPTRKWKTRDLVSRREKSFTHDTSFVPGCENRYVWTGYFEKHM